MEKTSMRRALTIAAGAILLLTFASLYPGIRASYERRGLRGVVKHVREIADAERRYYDKHGEFLQAQPHPPGAPGNIAIPWRSGLTAEHGFVKLGWSPGDEAYCRYSVNATASMFTVEVACHALQDQPVGYIGYVHTPPGETIGLDGLLGVCTGAGIEAGRGCLVNTVGPCQKQFTPNAPISVAAGRNSDLNPCPAR